MFLPALKPQVPVTPPFMRFEGLNVLDSRPMNLKTGFAPSLYRDDKLPQPMSILGTPARYSAGRNHELKTNTPVTINICSFRPKKYNEPAVTSLAASDLVFSRRHNSDALQHTNYKVFNGLANNSNSSGVTVVRDPGEFFSLSAVNYILRSEYRQVNDCALVLDEFFFLGGALSVDQLDSSQRGVHQEPRLDAAINVSGPINVPNIWQDCEPHQVVGLQLIRVPDSPIDHLKAAAKYVRSEKKAFESLTMPVVTSGGDKEEEERLPEKGDGEEEKLNEKNSFWQFQPVIINHSTPPLEGGVIRLGVLSQKKGPKDSEHVRKQKQAVAMPANTDWPTAVKALSRGTLHLGA